MARRSSPLQRLQMPDVQFHSDTSSPSSFCVLIINSIISSAKVALVFTIIFYCYYHYYYYYYYYCYCIYC
jgi:hypothetical protein